MRTFENKKTNFEEGQGFLGYANLALTCLNTVPPSGGILPLEMAKRIKLINQLQDVKIGEKIEVEDDHYQILKKCANETQWRMIHEEIVAFTEYVNNME